MTTTEHDEAHQERKASKASVIRAEHAWVHWAHTVPPDLHWSAACVPQYWGSIIEKLKPGDTITVHSADSSHRFRVLVHGANPAMDYLHISLQAIYPENMRLP